MDTEFEAKFYPVDKEKYRQKLLSLGAKLIHPERLIRRSLFDSLFYPQIKCNYIRIRDEGDAVRLSAKTHAKAIGKVSDQKELDVIVSDYDKTLEIFAQMGFQPNSYQETLRETWELESAEITIDTWPGLLPYSEIETSSEAEVKRLAKKLGFDWNKKIITAAEVYSAVYHLDLTTVLKKLQYITFDKNPFFRLPVFPILNQQQI